MKAEYYNYIKEKLQTIDDIKVVGRWKNQIQANQIATTPAVFIEIEPITYDSDTRRQQSATAASVILHQVTEKYSTEDQYDDMIYTLSQKIFNVLHNAENLERSAEALDTSWDNLEDFQLTYLITRLEDKDAMRDYTEIDRPPIEFESQMKDPDGS